VSSSDCQAIEDGPAKHYSVGLTFAVAEKWSNYQTLANWETLALAASAFTEVASIVELKGRSAAVLVSFLHLN